MLAAPLPDRTTGPRLTVRRWEVDDVAALAAAVTASLDHLRPWMPWIEHEPLALDARTELVRGWTTDWAAGGDVVVGLFRDDVVVGGAGLHRRVGPGALEIGYWVHVDHIGHGYATEAATVLTDLAFTVTAIDRVEIHHDLANTASAAVPRRLGFVWMGSSTDEVRAPAEQGVEGRWAMTRASWAARSANPSSPPP